MSTTIDQRVVEMRFDNKQFESGVSTTMSTLDKLKKSLNMDGVSKGFDNISNSAKRVDMSGLSGAVQTVQAKFSSLEVMAVTALANITNSAVNAGKRIVSALTIEPITTGFKEYETQINAIQTILANTSSKGTTLDQVNQALDELNLYADKTIYNFTEMTKNIGTFTAAGVELDTAVSAIKGIANLAAVSGSTSQQASTAMYQLSQALASGTVKLMDWNSVVNAGMGGQVFQDAIKETARLHGVAIDQMIKDEGSFRETLRLGWFTSDILTDTLAKFTGDLNESQLRTMGYTEQQIKSIIDMGKMANDAATKVKTLTQLFDTLKEAAQSGWAQTWELIVGDFEEAKSVFTVLSDTIGGAIAKSAESRNAMLSWALDSPWESLVKKVETAGVKVDDFKKALKDTARENGVNVDYIISKYGSFEKSLEANWVTADLVAGALKRLVKDADGVSGATEDMTAKLKKFQKIVDQVWRGDFGNAEARVKALTEAGYDYAEVQELVNKCQDGYRLKLEDLSDSQLKSIGYTEEQIKTIRDLAKEAESTGSSLNELLERMAKPSGRELLIDTINNSLQFMSQILEIVGGAWEKVFPKEDRADSIYGVIELLHDFSESLTISEKAAENFSTVMEGVFSAMQIAKLAISRSLTSAIKLLSAILSVFDTDILSVAAAIAEYIIQLKDWIEANTIFIGTFDKIAQGIKTVITTVKDWIKQFMSMPEVTGTIAKFQEAFAKTIDNFGEYLAEGKKRFVEFLDEIRNLDSISLADAQEIFRKFKEKVVDYFLGLGDVTKDLRTVISDFAIKIKDKIVEFANKAREKFGFVGEALMLLKDKFVEFATYLKDKFDIGTLLAIGSGVAIIMFIRNLSKALKSISGFSVAGLLGLDGVLDSYANLNKAKALKEMATAVGILAAAVAVLAIVHSKYNLWPAVGALGALAGGLLVFITVCGLLNKFKLYGEMSKFGITLVAFAGSLLILALAVKQLEGVEFGAILKGVVALAAIAAVLVGVVRLLSGKEIAKLPAAGIFLITFALSLKILASALGDFEAIDVSGKTVLKMAAVIGALALIVAAAKNVRGTALLSMLGAVITLKLVIGMVDDIAKIDSSKIKNNLGNFIFIFGMFGAMMLSARLAGANAAKAGVAVLAMTIALILIIQVIKMMSKINASDIQKSLGAISLIEAMFAGLIYMTKFAGQYAGRAGLMLMEMSAALLILTGVIAILAKIAEKNPAGLWQAVGAVAVLEVIFGGLIGMTKFAGEKVKGTLIVLAVVAGMFAIVIAALSAIDSSKLWNATGAISTVLTVFGLMIGVTKFTKNTKQMVRTLFSMVAVIGLLGVILTAMSLVPNPNNLIPVAEALSILLLALSASMVLIGHTGRISATVKTNLPSMLLAVTALAAILAALSFLPNPNTLIPTAIALSILLGAVSGCLVLLGMVGPTAGVAVKAAMLMGVVVGELAVVLGLMSHFDVEPSLETAAALSLLLLSLSGALVILSVVGATGASSFIGIGALATMIAAVGGLIVGLGALQKKYPALEEFLDTGLPMLEKIGKGIGSFAGNLIGGFIGGVAAGLVEAGKCLSGFMDESKGFFDGVKNIDVESTEGIKNLAEAFLVLTAGNLLNTVTKFFGGESIDFVTFGEQLKAFGYAIVQYSSTVSGKIDEGAVTASATAGKTLAELANSLPAYGDSLKTWILGDKIDLATFGTQLAGFGYAIAQYSGIVSGNIDEGAITASANAGKTLAELANSLPAYGDSVKTWLMGKQINLATFGTQLGYFGTAIVHYSRIVAGNVDEKAVTASANAGMTLAELAGKLPSVGGKIGEWFGDEMSLTDFGVHLVSFGQSLVDYSNTISGKINEDAIVASANAATAIAELATKLPTTNGTISGWFFSETIDIATFGKQLVSFGADFKAYSEHMKGVDAGVVSATTNAANSLVALATGLPENKLFKNETTLDEFGKQLSKFGGYFADYYTEVEGIALYKLTGVIDELNRLVNLARSTVGLDTSGLTGFSKALKDMGKAGIDGLIDEFYNGTIRINTAIVEMTYAMNVTFIAQGAILNATFKLIIDGMYNALVAKQKDFGTAGKELIVKLISGIKAKAPGVKAAVTALIASALTEIRNGYTGFYNAGVHLGDGLAAGIESAIRKVAAKARAMVRAAIEAAEDEAEINSPSKVTTRDGEYFGMGFVNGIDAYVDKAYKSGASLAEKAKIGLSEAISKITDAVNGDLDVQPTIRPVLDLSDVRSKAGSLNAMFSRSQAMSISTGMNRSASETIQNGETSTSGGTSYNFTQNNYSPKALSRVEIYRQTKNQFSAIERMGRA